MATPEAWQRNPALVLDFYNQRRRQLYQVEPNPGHRAIAELERRFRVSVLTQNVDNLSPSSSTPMPGSPPASPRPPNVI